MATEKITKMLYNDTVQVDFLPNSHRYKINGESMRFSMSKVSGIIDKPFLLRWACNCMRDELLRKLPIGITANDINNAVGASGRIKDQAASIGTYVHEFCEAFALFKMGKGDKPDFPKIAIPEGELEEGEADRIANDNKAIINGCNGFLEWITSHNVEFLEVERFVYSKAFHVVGIFDVVAIVDGKKKLIDYKTSKSFYELEHGIQTMGYKIAYEEESGETGTERMVLRFDKITGEFHPHDLNNDDDDRQAFIAGLTLVRRKLEVEDKEKAAKKAAKEAAKNS